MSSQMHSKLKFLYILIITIILGFCTPEWASAQQQEDERYKIQWRDYSFYTNRPMPAMVKALTLEAYSDTVEGYYFVQFAGPITKEMKAQVIDAGGKLFNYVPNNTYIVKMTNAVRNRVEALQNVSWVGVYQPAMSVSQRLTNLIEGVEIEPPPPPGQLKFAKPDTAGRSSRTSTIATDCVGVQGGGAGKG